MWIALTVLGCTGDSVDDTATPTSETGQPSDTGEVDSETRAARIAKLAPSTSAGQTGYGKFCVGCHAANGTGVNGQGPSLVDRLMVVTARESVLVILDGKGTMPSFDASLSDQEIADVTAYMLDSFGPG